MRIRSVTVFANLAPELPHAELAKLGAFASAARGVFERAGFEVQTTRLAVRAADILQDSEPGTGMVAWCQRLESAAAAEGFQFVSIGPLPADLLPQVPAILAATSNVFAVGHIVDPASGCIDGQAIRACADAIRSCAEIEDGFGNLRFAALANVRPFTPFFPGSFGDGGPTAFAIATESADMAMCASAAADDAASAHDALRDEIERCALRIESVAQELENEHGVAFKGIDFSLAPFPADTCSIGAAMETLIGQPLGSPGSLAAAATLTDAIDSARFMRTGYSGLMLPVLEDPVLGKRSAEGLLNIGELLQWSAVCGTGLDTVPIPGDTGTQALMSVLYDVAALAVRLSKPLTARLMPLPGKVAGDPVHFDFDYFCDGGVLAMPDPPATGLYQGGADLALSARKARL